MLLRRMRPRIKEVVVVDDSSLCVLLGKGRNFEEVSNNNNRGNRTRRLSHPLFIRRNSVILIISCLLLLSQLVLQISCYNHNNSYIPTNNMKLFQRIQRSSSSSTTKTFLDSSTFKTTTSTTKRINNHYPQNVSLRRKYSTLLQSSSQQQQSPWTSGPSIPSPSSSQPKHHQQTKAKFRIPMPQWNNSNSFLSSLSTPTSTTNNPNGSSSSSNSSSSTSNDSTTQNENEALAVSPSSSNSSTSTSTTSELYETIFTLDLPEGKCVGLRLSTQYQESEIPTSLCPTQIQSNENHWIKQILHPEEVQYGMELPSEPARLTFFIGRLAMRTALKLAISGCNDSSNNNDDDDDSQSCNDISIGYEDKKFVGGFIQLPTVTGSDHSILKDEHGRPQVPKGFIGSISHKKTTGVALISSVPDDDETYTSSTEGTTTKSKSTSSPKIGIGVDIEQTFSRRKSIAKKILTKNELENLGKLKGITRDEEVLLRFSLKECVYKAMHPLISQWVGFQEAEIEPHDDGTATVKLNLKSGAHEQFQSIDAHWRRLDGEFFLTSSCVKMKDDQ